MTQWYEALFANFGKTYDKESFTQGTVGEVDFVERELGADRSKRILDIGCGTGRHAIELAKRGYRVTGFDLSEGQLRLAREKAAAAGVTVDFQCRDATQPHFNQEFDAAIMFCEGAFPLMETDEKNYAILTHAAAALRPGGKLLLTTLNALFPLFHSVKDFLDAGKSGTATGKLDIRLDDVPRTCRVDVHRRRGPDRRQSRPTNAITRPPKCVGYCRRPALPKLTSSAATWANSAATTRSRPTISRCSWWRKRASESPVRSSSFRSSRCSQHQTVFPPVDVYFEKQQLCGTAGRGGKVLHLADCDHHVPQCECRDQ